MLRISKGLRSRLDMHSRQRRKEFPMRHYLTRISAAASVLALVALALPAGPVQASTRPVHRNPTNRPAWPCPQPNALVGSSDTGTVLPFNTNTRRRSSQPISAPVRFGPGTIAITPDGWTAYVVGNSSVTPVSLGTCSALPAITTGTSSFNVAITPDGKTAYVTNSGSATVTPIRTKTNTPLPVISVGSNPQAIAITPDSTTAYVLNRGSNTVTPIDTATNDAGGPISVGGGPSAIAITQDGTTAYVVNSNSNSVTPIDTATNDAGAPISVGTHPTAIAIAPDGTTAYVVNSNSNSVTPIDTATNHAGAPISVGSDPIAIAITPDGTTAYVLNESSGTVTPIDTDTNHAGPAIGVWGVPVAIGISRNGATAYIADRFSRAITPIDTATNTDLPAIGTVSDPTVIAIAPVTPYKSAIITTTHAGVGVTQWGDLNIPAQAPSAQGTRTYGLRYLPTNNEFSGAGCPCEGWGVADPDIGVTGYADQATGTAGLKVLGFRRLVNKSTHQVFGAQSVVTVGTTFKVTNIYSAATADLIQDQVTITNISDSDVGTVLYRRLVDWDMEPTAFSEYVTIEGNGSSPALTGTTNDGFDSADPLSASNAIGIIGNAVRYGPMDQGVQFNFNFGALAASASKTFTVYYGAAGGQAQAYTDLGNVHAQAYALGEPSSSADGTPNTAMLGFSGVGGPALSFPPSPLPPLTVHGKTLLDGEVQMPYDDTLSATGGTPPYSWSMVGGSLPPGLSLGSDGELSGTPTSAGTWQFTARVDDAANGSATGTFVVSIDQDFASTGGAVIKSGNVGMGIVRWGNLDVPDRAPSAQGTTTYGLRYLPTNNEFLGPGCPCEGWGVADQSSLVTGSADQASGIDGLRLISFSSTPTTAISTVAVGSTFDVTNFYAPVKGQPDLFKDKVTIKNISGATTGDVLYRLVDDWDMEPTAFDELVTIQGFGNSPALVRTTNSGFDSADPLSPSDDNGATGNFVRFGPQDQGAQFDFDFGTLDPGASITFTEYWGAAATEAAAYTDLAAVGVQAYTLGEPSSSSDGSPNTAILGFSGIGGSNLPFPPA